MERIAWKRLSQQWPVIFCLAVIAWFAISAAGVPDRVRSIVPDTNRSAEPTAVNVSNALDVKVESFYLERSDPGNGLDAKVTLEVTNASASNTEFRPGTLQLVRSDGSTYSPSEVRPATVQVAPTVPVLTSVTFPVDARPGSNWEIQYGERTVYEGIPR